MCVPQYKVNVWSTWCIITPGETEYEWKKTEQVPIQLPNIARTLFDAKKIIKKKFLSLDIGDNPIYPIWKSHGRAWIAEIFFGICH